MAYSVEDSRRSVTMKTQEGAKTPQQTMDWWNANSKMEMAQKLLTTASFLKTLNNNNYLNTMTYLNMYENKPVMTYGNPRSRNSRQLPAVVDVPSMNVISSCTDTLVSRITQSRPRPVFLTENAHYKQRTLAKQMNNFIQGELYQTKAHELGRDILRDACITGTGVLKILEYDNKVKLERRLFTDLLVDPNDAYYGCPTQIYEIKMVDRQILKDMFPSYRSLIEKAENGTPENSPDQSIADLVIVVEGWHLRSGPDAKNGMHSIVCSSGIIFEESYERDEFPFVFFPYSPPMTGFWGQALAERLMGTQLEIKRLLKTITASINLVGVPRVFVEDGSAVVKAHLNDQIGSIVTYRGTKPEYTVAPCVPAELYEQLQRLVTYAYQQEGISTLAAQSQKPAGLNSGVAMREYDDIQSDRFATISKAYENFYIDVSKQILTQAIQIAKREGKYETIYPAKDGTKRIDLPEIEKLEKDPYVIQCYSSSSLPKDPAGRLQKVTEMMQASIITPQEGRRLLDFPDIEQVDRLANSSEERILKMLDEIIEDGTPAEVDPFMDLVLAKDLVKQYYNLYVPFELEPEKINLLVNFATQIDGQTQSMMAPPMAPPMGGPAGGMANPIGLPTNDLMSNVRGTVA